MNVYVRELSRHLADRGIAVDVFTRRQAPGTPDVVEIVPGARVIHLDAGPQRHVDKYEVLDYVPDFTCGVQRWRALTGVSYDLIHSHYWLSGAVATLLRQHWGVPVVTMFHTLAELKNRVAESAAETEQMVRYDIERRTMDVADRIVAATEIDKAQIMRHYAPASPISVIPGGVDLDTFAPRGRSAARRELGIAESRVLLFVGRIQRLKGVEILVRALHALVRTGDADDTRLLIVGGGENSTGQELREIQRLQRLVSRLRLDGRVTFVGAVQQERLPLYYSAADLTVMPSSYESFGLVAVESLACGTPVVATRVGGLTAIVRDGETGALVPWRDADLFAERLRSLLADPEEREHLAANARASVLRFGWDRIADEHLSLYADVLAGQRQLATAGAAF